MLVAEGGILRLTGALKGRKMPSQKQALAQATYSGCDYPAAVVVHKHAGDGISRIDLWHTFRLRLRKSSKTGRVPTFTRGVWKVRVAETYQEAIAQYEPPPAGVDE